MNPRFHIVGYRTDALGRRTGVLMMIDDKIPDWMDGRAVKSPRPFQEHTHNGQPKPMDLYFKNVR